MSCLWIIIPCFNRYTVTRDCINQIYAQTLTSSSIEIIIVDDNSPDKTGERLKAEFKNIHILYTQGNYWFGGCLKKGLKYVKGQSRGIDDFIMIVNDDVIFDHDYFIVLQNYLHENPNRKCIASCLKNLETGEKEFGIYLDWNNFTFSKVGEFDQYNIVSTRGLIVSNELLDICLNSLYATALPHYLSDYGLTYRLTKFGFKPLFVKGLSLASYPQKSFKELHGKTTYIDRMRNPNSLRHKLPFIALFAPKIKIPFILIRMAIRLVKTKYA